MCRLRGRLLFCRTDFVVVRLLRCWQFLGDRRCDQLQRLPCRVVRFEFGYFGLFVVSGGHLFDRRRGDARCARPGEQLHLMRGGDVFNGDGSHSVGRLFPLRRRFFRGRRFSDDVRFVLGRPVRCWQRCGRMRQLRRGPVPDRHRNYGM